MIKTEIKKNPLSSISKEKELEQTKDEADCATMCCCCCFYLPFFLFG